jgi:phospholipid/cholesterol/gamma-HCH transport system substrate-binding protein
LTVARVAGFGALVLAVILAAWLLIFRSPGGHEYTILFENAGQLVKDDDVQVGGIRVGSVRDIRLTRDNQAAIDVKVQEPYAPLRVGTKAVIRLTSLSGVANRYIALTPAPDNAPKLHDGSTLDETSTTTVVDLDEIFNTLDPKTRRNLSSVIKGFSTQFRGKGKLAGQSTKYFNPVLSTSRQLVDQVDQDEGALTRFLVNSSRAVTAIASKRDDLAALVGNTNTTAKAIGDENVALARALGLLPTTLRRANTTFVNLRSTLDTLTPLVDESKPVAKRLQPLFAALRPFAQDARPTIADLANIISRPGKANDLIELTREAVPLAAATVHDVHANGKTREGAFPAATKALQGSIPSLAYARPYAPDLEGWFDDFSHSGVSDALGGASRAAPVFSAFTPELNNGLLELLPISDPKLRQAAFSAVAKVGQYDRCPGSMERDPGDHSTTYDPYSGSNPNFDCDPTQTPFGP